MPRLSKKNIKLPKNNKKKSKKKENYSGKINFILLIVILQTFFLVNKNFNYLKNNIINILEEHILQHSIFSSYNPSKDSQIKSYEKMKADLSKGEIISDSLDVNNDGRYDIENPVPLPDIIKINILNACGKRGLAGQWKSIMRKKNYDVREIGNASIRQKSVILCRLKNMKPAYELAEKLGIDRENVLLQIDKDLVDIDLTLIIGKDYQNLNKE